MKVQFLEGSFVDFKNQKHTFIVTAVPENTESIAFTGEELDNLIIASDGTCLDCIESAVNEVNSLAFSKKVMFGVSFCHPNDSDKYDLNLGVKIATGKAKCRRTRIGEIAYSSGMLIKYDHIQECLKRYVEVISKHPEYYSKSYAKSLEKYKEYVGNLSDAAVPQQEVISKL